MARSSSAAMRRPEPGEAPRTASLMLPKDPLAQVGARLDPERRIDAERRRGRGATANPSGRFEPFTITEEDDGWGSMEEAAAFSTQITFETPRTIITRNESPDIGFDRSVNPYRGCEHGCVYCFARPSHAYMGLSPGLDFETKLFAKPNAAALLTKELSAKGYEPRSLAIGTNTDPYQPIEKKLRIMRQVLEVLERANHPVGIVTKSALVTRDIDILSRMASRGLAKVALSVTTLDPKLARVMEPRAATPGKRIDAIRQLAEAGIPVTVMTAPIVPAINDHEIEKILETAYHAGAREAGYVMLRLPHELKDLFKDWLHANFPGKLKHVMSLVRSIHGGKDYNAEFGERQVGSGPYAWMIGRRFEMAAERLGYSKRRSKLRTDLFVPPDGSARQLALF